MVNFRDIIFMNVGEYYIPIFYTDMKHKKPVQIGDYIKNHLLPDGYDYLFMLVPEGKDVPEEVSGLCVPIICEVRDDGYYPLMGEAFVKYGVSFTENVLKSAEYLTQLHYYVTGDKKPLGDLEGRCVDYETVHEQFYESYTLYEEHIKQEEMKAARQKAKEESANRKRLAEVAEEKEVEPATTKIESNDESDVKSFDNEENSIPTEIEQEQEPVAESQGSTNKVEGQLISSTEQVANFRNVITSKSGAYIIIHEASQELLAQQKETILGLGETELPIAFTPNVRKYELPVGTVDIESIRKQNPNAKYVPLAGMSYEEFEDRVLTTNEMTDVEISANGDLRTFTEEVEEVLGGKVPYRKLINTISPESGDGLQILYNLVKYVILEESPNELYDNLYSLCYILETELALQGVTKEYMDFRMAYILAGLACDAKKVEVDEQEVAYDEDKEDGEQDDSQFSINELKEDVRKANDEIRELLINAILGKSPINFMGNNNLDIDVIRKICINGKYGLTFRLKDKALDLAGFKLLDVIIKEYDIGLYYLGTSVDVTTLGKTVNMVNDYIYNNQSNMDSEEFNSILKELLKSGNYNETLTALKNTNPFISNYTKEALKLFDFEKLDLKLEKIFAAIYDGKVRPFSILISNNAPGTSAAEKFLLMPVTTTIYKTMAEAGIPIKGILESTDDVLLTGIRFEENGIVKQVSILGMKNLDRSKVIPIQTSTPPTTLNAIFKIIHGGTFNGVDTKMVNIPSWIKEDAKAVEKGLTEFFGLNAK